MDKMVEIMRRSRFHEEKGLPIHVMYIYAEIAVNDNGKTVYLYAGVMDDCDFLHTFSYVTTESIYAIEEKIDEKIDAGIEDGVRALMDRRDFIIANASIKKSSRYRPFFEEMKQMILKEMEEHGISDDISDDDELEF